jgi:hypothetical protein
MPGQGFTKENPFYRKGVLALNESKKNPLIFVCRLFYSALGLIIFYFIVECFSIDFQYFSSP